MCLHIADEVEALDKVSSGRSSHERALDRRVSVLVLLLVCDIDDIVPADGQQVREVLEHLLADAVSLEGQGAVVLLHLRVCPEDTLGHVVEHFTYRVDDDGLRRGEGRVALYQVESLGGILPALHLERRNHVRGVDAVYSAVVVKEHGVCRAARECSLADARLSIDEDADMLQRLDFVWHFECCHSL